jgi:hypothetical protein
MQKNKIRLWLFSAVVCTTFIIVSEQREEGMTDSTTDEETIPLYLRDKRKNDKQIIEAFIQQRCGEEGNIRSVGNDMISMINKNVYDSKVKLCYAPKFISFVIWALRFAGWDSSELSDLETKIKNIDNWYYIQKKEINDLVQKYEKSIPEADAIVKQASTKLKNIFLSKQGDFREIGRKTEHGVELLHEPNKKYLVKQPDIIQEKIIVKFARDFHNHEIPITYSELVRILAADLPYMQRKSELEEILNNINTIVVQYEQRQQSNNQQKN